MGPDANDIIRLAEGLLTELESAADTLLFPSGMAAIAAIGRTLAEGDRLILQSGIYWGTTKWFREFAVRRGIDLVEIDAADANLLDAEIKRFEPTMVFVETPSNPWLKIVDIERAAAACRNCAACLVVDSTAATPILSHPLALGADFVLHSATKALGGHSDLLAGVLSCASADTARWEAVRADRHDAGAICSPFDAWLLVRSLRTLPLRVERMSASAQFLADALTRHPKVKAVLYPGLPDNPGHDVAHRQMQGGFGSLLSILVEGDGARALAVCSHLQLFHRATSLGGVESLVEHRHTVEGGDNGVTPDLIRLSIGIEHPDDLKTDLFQALEAVS